MQAGFRRISQLQRRRQSEPTLPLINIVFLMLIFFLAAAQLARPLGPDLQLIDTEDPAAVPPPDAVVLQANGEISFRGQRLSPTAIFAILAQEHGEKDIVIRLVPDRRSDAIPLADLARKFRHAGASAVHIVTERAQK